MESKDLVTYCGGYCGECALFPGFTALREAALILGELIDTHGLQNWIPEAWTPDAWTPDAENKFDFAEFRKGLTFFSAPESWYACRECCKSGGGWPECPMRKCCREREIDICFDCGDFPCSKVKWNPIMIKRGDEYKKLGKGEWLREREKNANQGFELYAGKYYQVRAVENPPES
jgi:hypothetical protein